MPADIPAHSAAAAIEMFSGPGCAFCEQSRALFASKGLPYVEYDVSDDEHLAEYRLRLPRERSLPQIFVNGGHIGSFEDLQLLADTGELDG